MADWIEWPNVLVPRTVTVVPPSKTKSSSTSLTDFVQTVPVIRPPWRVRLEFSTLGTRAEVLAYRALEAALEGRSGRVRLPIFDLHYWATDTQLGLGSVPHGDGSTFSDEAEYLTGDLTGIAMSGLQGERTVSIDFGSYGSIVEAGQYIGFGNDLHIMTRVEWAGSVASMRLSPSLRRDHVGEAVRLRPYLIASKVDDEGGELSLDYGRWGAPTLDFVEAFYEPLP